MRTWFYDHPSITFALLCLWCLICGTMFGRALFVYDGWWRLFAVMWLILDWHAIEQAGKWWHRT